MDFTVLYTFTRSAVMPTAYSGALPLYTVYKTGLEKI